MIATQQIAEPIAPYTPPTPAGVARGTEIMTMCGLAAVETLGEGDRIVTRTGARKLKAVKPTSPDHFALIFDRPQIVYLLDKLVHSESGAQFVA